MSGSFPGEGGRSYYLGKYEVTRAQFAAVMGLERLLAASGDSDLAGELKDEFLMLQRHFPYQISRRNPESREILEAITTGFLDGQLWLWPDAVEYKARRAGSASGAQGGRGWRERQTSQREGQ